MPTFPKEGGHDSLITEHNTPIIQEITIVIWKKHTKTLALHTLLLFN